MAAALSPVIMIRRPLSIARLLRVGETLPADLNVGLTRIDPLWTWVVASSTGIESCLLAAPCHGLAMLVRICSLPSASPYTIAKLLRRSLTDIHDRGYNGYFTCLDPDNPMEAKLISIVKHSGGINASKGILLAGKTDIGGL